MFVCVFFFLFCFVLFFQQKNGASNIVATAQMKFAPEARPSQYIVPFGNKSRLVCHYLDTLWTLRVGS